jgi:cell division control protein 7
MAKARVSLQRQAEQIDVHEDDQKEEEVNSELGESMDPLDESGHTVDSSDEEVEDAVAEDMARFEESFAGINKRFRLINRIGEGKSSRYWPAIYAGSHGRAHNVDRNVFYCL